MFALHGVSFLVRGMLFGVRLLVRKFLVMRFFMAFTGACQGFSRKHFHRRADCGRQRLSSALRLLMRMHRVIIFEVFENVADVEERVAIKTDVHESRLHSGKDAGDFSFVDAADQRELFFALDVNFD
jgi:hypothetical protein